MSGLKESYFKRSAHAGRGPTASIMPVRTSACVRMLSAPLGTFSASCAQAAGASQPRGRQRVAQAPGQRRRSFDQF